MDGQYNPGLIRIFLNFMSQLQNEIINRSGGWLLNVTPYIFEELITADGIIAVVPQIL